MRAMIEFENGRSEARRYDEYIQKAVGSALDHYNKRSDK